MEQRTVRVAGVIGITAALAVGGVALGLAVSNGTPGASGPTTPASASAACGGSAPKLTVEGTGNASATPNLLTVTVDIEVTDPSAQASLVDDNTKASAVSAVLERGGVAAKDIQTSDVSIEPQYSTGGTITGYQMTNTLTAKLHNFSTAGSVLDNLSAAAGNAGRIDSLTFSIEDPRAVEDTARSDAVRQAVSHARTMAQAAGERLGPVCSLTDQSTPDFGIEEPLAVAGAAAHSAQSAVPLQPGTQEESAQVSVVYALRQATARG